MLSKFVVMPEIAQIALEWRDKFGLTAFIETGTFNGETTEWASQHFDTVYTIEIQPLRVVANVKKFADYPNVTVIAGDSGQQLPKLLDELGDTRALLFLDAHLTGPTEGQECALREELLAIAPETQHCVMIDDANWFTYCLPSAARKPNQFPHYQEIKEILSSWKLWELSGNVIAAIPKQFEISRG